MLLSTGTPGECPIIPSPISTGSQSQVTLCEFEYLLGDGPALLIVLVVPTYPEWPAAILIPQHSGAAHPMTRVAAAMQDADNQHSTLCKCVKDRKRESAQKGAASRSMNQFEIEWSLGKSHKGCESFVEKLLPESALLPPRTTMPLRPCPVPPRGGYRPPTSQTTANTGDYVCRQLPAILVELICIKATVQFSPLLGGQRKRLPV
jgi:hypothetical protein